MKKLRRAMTWTRSFEKKWLSCLWERAIAPPPRACMSSQLRTQDDVVVVGGAVATLGAMWP